MTGLETLAAQGKSQMSRIDVLLDQMLDKLIASDPSKADVAHDFRGQVAILSAQAAYQIYKELFESERFCKLKLQGARPQRLLWTSTSTKNPAYSDLKYVEALIGPETIVTIPLETLTAYRNHGKPASRLTIEAAVKSRETLQRLGEIGIDLDAATTKLEHDGVQKFAKAFDLLMHTLEEKRTAAVRSLTDVGTVDPGVKV